MGDRAGKRSNPHQPPPEVSQQHGPSRQQGPIQQVPTQGRHVQQLSGKHGQTVHQQTQQPTSVQLQRPTSQQQQLPKQQQQQIQILSKHPKQQTPHQHQPPSVQQPKLQHQPTSVQQPQQPMSSQQPQQPKQFPVVKGSSLSLPFQISRKSNTPAFMETTTPITTTTAKQC